MFSLTPGTTLVFTFSTSYSQMLKNPYSGKEKHGVEADRYADYEQMLTV